VNILVAGHFLNPERIPNYPNMKYIGIIENVYESLRESDILIFPSIVPHFAKPVIEAGMCKLPVIVSDVKGMEEIVKLHYNGILFPVGDVHALAEAINLLASSSTLREEYGHNNFKMVKDKFSVEVNLRIIQKEYLR
jgi:glycosyltransferase involved in cell wall biosynthesis